MRAMYGGCMNRCSLEEGQTGMCQARKNTGGAVIPVNYGKITSMALDLIEKKPPRWFLPGSVTLSVGSFGCSPWCPFCQNHKISMAGEGDFESAIVSPEELAQKAAELGKNGNIGVAYTYNESLAGWEYVRGIGCLARKAGMKNVVVTNGSASDQVLNEILPVADAMNVDLRGFTENHYKKLGGGSETVKHFITCASRRYHAELIALIAPGENDLDKGMREMMGWISSLSPEIPFYVTRFFPRWKMDDRPATNMARVYALVQTAREYSRYVWTGNC